MFMSNLSLLLRTDAFYQINNILEVNLGYAESAHVIPLLTVAFCESFKNVLVWPLLGFPWTVRLRCIIFDLFCLVNYIVSSFPLHHFQLPCGLCAIQFNSVCQRHFVSFWKQQNCRRFICSWTFPRDFSWGDFCFDYKHLTLITCWRK